MQIKYYIDMDGVLAKWNEYASEEETHEPGYFINRDVQKNAVAMVNMLANAGEDVKILSSVYEDDHSAADKEKWLKKHGIKIPHIFVPYGKDKYSYIDAEKDDLPVLIDDYSKNLNAWEKKGYLPIKFFNGINNRPRFRVVGSTVEIDTDTWAGFSIDHRMTPQQMYAVVHSVPRAYAA